MSEWFYIWLSYGITWIALFVYFFRLRARRVAALRVLTDTAGPSSAAGTSHSAGTSHE